MPTPFFPNELVTHIFESLYTSLRSNPLYSPVSINSIFAPFTVVDKRWRSLSLPYLVRHYDRPSHSVLGFLEYVNKYELNKEVTSIHFALETPPPTSYLKGQSVLIQELYGAQLLEYEVNNEPEKLEAMQEWISATALDARELVSLGRDKKVEEERERWQPLASGYLPHIENIEVGKRSKFEDFDDTLDVEFWKEIRDYRHYNAGPGEDITSFLYRFKWSNVKKLRINLLSGSSIADIHELTPSNFPNVEDLIIHHYQGHDDDMRPTGHYSRSPIWKNLRRLTLINVASYPEMFPRHITDSYLQSSSATLTYLELKMHPQAPHMIATSWMPHPQQYLVVDMFGHLVFPAMEEVKLKLKNLPQNEEVEVENRFPNAKHFSLEVERET